MKLDSIPELLLAFLARLLLAYAISLAYHVRYRLNVLLKPV